MTPTNYFSPKQLTSEPLTFSDLNQDWFDLVWAIEQQVQVTPWQLNMIYQEPKAHHYQKVLHQNKQIIGYFYSQFIVDEATLLNIAIAPYFQKQGYGTLLLNYFLEHIKIKNAASVWLEVRKSNLAAQHLYEKYGFNLVDTRLNYYPTTRKSDGKKEHEHALIMCKKFL